jgi:hypothetical protein
LRFDPDWQSEIECRSLARLGFGPDPPAVHLDDALSDRQPETGPTLLARNGAVRLLKFFEDLGLIGCVDAGSSVAYSNRERPVRCLGAEGDLALVGEFDRVAD